jgi:hypothetical protein
MGEDQVVDGGGVKVGVNPDDIDQFLKLLTQAPRHVSIATKGVPNVRLTLRTEEEPWSVSDILAHLRASADVREKYINAMLTQNNPAIRYISPRTYIEKTDYLELPFPESFQAYEKQRGLLLNMLKDFSLKDWSRSTVIKERP